MSSDSHRTLIQNLVVQFVNEGRMFTAYDVTVAARQQGAQLKHGEARDVVHQLHSAGVMGPGYQRTVVEVQPGVRPFVFHRFSDNPQTYNSGGGNSGTENAANPTSTKPGIVGRIVGRIFGRTPDPTAQDKKTGDHRTQNATSSAASASPTYTWVGVSPNQTVSPTPVPVPQPRPQRRDQTIDLDAGAFLPISRNDLLKAMKGTNLWSSVWFGRRDLIPPINDPRTLLIDRGMLSAGLLSAQQLAEIHEVGATMDKYRPAELLLEMQARQAGQSAVEDKRAERERIKQEKKAAAKARREQREKAILERHQNDIQFLGRRVSHRLAERQSDKARLDALGLLFLETPQQLAEAIGISVPKLRWLAYHNQVARRTHYFQFAIAKKSGGQRLLSKPHDQLAMTQRWILHEILHRMPVEEAAHGFVRGRNIVSNATPHCGSDVVINMDLENFFPNITFPRVRHLFQRAGYSGAVATILALLCTECPRREIEFQGERFFVATGERGLPQGACTSPAISNLISQRLDRRITGLAKRMELRYTRYADDMTLSGNEELQRRAGYVMACVRHIAQDEGYRINPQKTRVLRKHVAQSVTGLVVNHKVTVSRRKIRQIRAILHQAQRDGLESQNREGHDNFRAWLEGYIAFIGMSRPEIAQQFREQLRQLT